MYKLKTGENFIQYIGITTKEEKNDGYYKDFIIQGMYHLDDTTCPIEEINKVYVACEVMDQVLSPLQPQVLSLCGKVDLKVEYIGQNHSGKLELLDIEKYLTTQLKLKYEQDNIYLTSCIRDAKIYLEHSTKLFFYVSMRVMENNLG